LERRQTGHRGYGQLNLIVKSFLTASTTAGRHARRIEKLLEIEQNLAQAITSVTPVNLLIPETRVETTQLC